MPIKLIVLKFSLKKRNPIRVETVTTPILRIGKNTETDIIFSPFNIK